MSDEAVIAQKGPYKVELKKGQRYFWCACGHSGKQPFCDGSHKKTNGITPIGFVAEEDKAMWLCGCKQTGGQPFCDGTHSKL